MLSINYTDIKTFTKTISEKLGLLLTTVKVKELIVIAGLKRIFLGANIEHKYPSAKKAFQFENITQSRNYEEAFAIGMEGLPAFIDFFLLERCDGSVPEFIFFFVGDNRLGFNWCKDGNVHTIEFEKETLSDSLLSKNQWKIIEGRCVDNFSSNSKIEGRITNT